VLGTVLSQTGHRLDALPALQQAAALSSGDAEAQNIWALLCMNWVG